MVRRKLKKKEIFLGFIVILIVFSILTFYIWHQVESVRLGYETGKLEVEVRSLENKVEELEVEKSSLLSLERVEKISKEKLGLLTVREDQIIPGQNKQN